MLTTFAESRSLKGMTTLAWSPHFPPFLQKPAMAAGQQPSSYSAEVPGYDHVLYIKQLRPSLNMQTASIRTLKSLNLAVFIHANLEYFLVLNTLTLREVLSSKNVTALV